MKLWIIYFYELFLFFIFNRTNRVQFDFNAFQARKTESNYVTSLRARNYIKLSCLILKKHRTELHLSFLLTFIILEIFNKNGIEGYFRRGFSGEI